MRQIPPVLGGTAGMVAGAGIAWASMGFQFAWFGALAGLLVGAYSAFIGNELPYIRRRCMDHVCNDLGRAVLSQEVGSRVRAAVVLIGLVLISLKITGQIGVGWVWVLAPFWGGGAVSLTLLGLCWAGMKFIDRVELKSATVKRWQRLHREFCDLADSFRKHADHYQAGGDYLHDDHRIIEDARRILIEAFDSKYVPDENRIWAIGHLLRCLCVTYNPSMTGDMRGTTFLTMSLGLLLMATPVADEAERRKLLELTQKGKDHG